MELRARRSRRAAQPAHDRPEKVRRQSDMIADNWSPKIAGDISSFHWHYHDAQDERFLVVAGRLRINFRNQIVDLEAGEFIVVPRGVEHLPEATSAECNVVLLEKATTLNTGNVENARTLRELDRLR